MTSPASARAGVATPATVLRAHAGFRAFFVSNALSNVGTWAQSIALSIAVYETTGSVSKVALLNFSRYVGSIVLPPLSGIVADRWNRAAVLAGTQLVAAVLAFVLFLDFWSTGSTFNRTLVLAAGMGMCDALAVPVMHALLPSLVPPPALPVAIALNATTFNVARAVGPLLGGALVATAGITVVLGLNVVSYVVLGVVVLRLRSLSPAVVREERVPRPFRDILRTRGLVPAYAAVAAASIAMDPVNTLTPAVAAVGLHFDASFAGVLTGAFGAGAVGAALFVVGRLRTSSRVVAIALAGIPLGMAPMWLDLGPTVVVLGLVVAGGAFLSSNAIATGTIHQLVPHEYRGRVMAIWSLCFLGTRPFASVVTGVVADARGYAAAGFLMGLPALAVAAALLRGAPSSANQPQEVIAS